MNWMALVDFMLLPSTLGGLLGHVGGLVCLGLPPTGYCSTLTSVVDCSAAMPVLFLLSGPKMGFSLRVVDTLPNKREIWHCSLQVRVFG